MTSMKSNYVELRDKVISEIINNMKIAYPNDREMLSIAIEATVELEIAENSEEFVKDLYGFMIWAQMTNQKASTGIATIMHDLHEFADNRFEKWFSPRTKGYAKYLSGSTNLQIC